MAYLLVYKGKEDIFKTNNYFFFLSAIYPNFFSKMLAEIQRAITE